jgi:16S rRNA (adenine1518-N6/adenine1519-N6)-dimethyltransferase
MTPSFVTRKSLGQHFLHDQAVLQRIAGLCLPASSLVEIGPGTGNLTRHLRGLDLPLTVVERDRRLPALLASEFPGLPVIEADAAELDWPALLADRGPQPVVVGNLPYYATFPILFATLEARPARLVFMVQKEVALRLAAKPATSAYGQVSVKLQLRADVQLALTVGRGAFQPPPKVESAVVVVTPLAAPRFPVAHLDRFDALVTAGFGQRRKTLVNALAAGGWQAAAVRWALQQMGLSETVRGEALGVAAWAQLAHFLG